MATRYPEFYIFMMLYWVIIHVYKNFALSIHPVVISTLKVIWSSLLIAVPFTNPKRPQCDQSTSCLFSSWASHVKAIIYLVLFVASLSAWRSECSSKQSSHQYVIPFYPLIVFQSMYTTFCHSPVKSLSCSPG